MAISSKKHQIALPRETVALILAKLPTETIRQCKLVCEEWRDIIISDPLFAETHYKNSHISLLIPCKSLDHPTNGLFMVESYKEGTKIHKIESLKLNLNFDKREFEIVNTCRGFLFLKCRKIASSQLLICNPLTNEYVKLPGIQPLFAGNSHLGFGLSPTTKQYKVVKLVHHLEKSYRVDIHTIGTNSGWRRIKEVPCQYIIWKFCNNPIEFRGVLHWSAWRMKMKMKMQIMCFNIDKEELDLMSMPCGVEVGWCHEIQIGVINALLCLSSPIPSSNSLKLWVMKDYGVEESWAQYVVIKPTTIPKLDDHSWFNGYQLVEVCGNGKILLLLPNKLLISYNPKKKRTRILQVWDNYSRLEFGAQLFIPSFFSLRNLC